MSLLVETIKCENGKLLNISYHNDRMFRSLSELYNKKTKIELEEIIAIPEFASTGTYKCRVVYDYNIAVTEFLPYSLRNIMSLKIVHENNINYPYKYTDRECINRLMAQKGSCDDILIVKSSLVTDASYANVVFRDKTGCWVTPSTCLLEGTKRASLLHRGVITERIIDYRDIKTYSEVRLINSMIEIDDTSGIPVINIF